MRTNAAFVLSLRLQYDVYMSYEHMRRAKTLHPETLDALWKGTRNQKETEFRLPAEVPPPHAFRQQESYLGRKYRAFAFQKAIQNPMQMAKLMEHVHLDPAKEQVLTLTHGVTGTDRAKKPILGKPQITELIVLHYIPARQSVCLGIPLHGLRPIAPDATDVALQMGYSKTEYPQVTINEKPLPLARPVSFHPLTGHQYLELDHHVPDLDECLRYHLTLLDSLSRSIGTQPLKVAMNDQINHEHSLPLAATNPFAHQPVVLPS